MKKNLRSRFNETNYGEQPTVAPEVDNNNPEEDKNKKSTNWKTCAKWGGITLGGVTLIAGGIWVGKKIIKGFKSTKEAILQQVAEAEEEAKPADKKEKEPAAK